MGSDPTFTTLAELQAWAAQRARYPDPTLPVKQAQLAALADIRRVTMAHSHLIGSVTHG